MISRSAFAVILAFAGAYPSPVFSDQEKANDPSPSAQPVKKEEGAFSWLPWWISKVEPRLLFGSVDLRLSNLPNSVRQVNEYNSTTQYLLPDQTGGSLKVVSWGLGFSFFDLNWLEFTLDVTQRTSNYTRGRSTWSEIGFPSDDYIGYVYRGVSLDPAIKIIPITYSVMGFEAIQAYFKVGLKKHFDTLSSGTDAWNKFTAQNNLNLNGYSHTIGFGFVFLMLNWEYQRSVSYSSYPRTVENTFLLGLTYSAVARKWCTRFRLSKWFCTIDPDELD